MPTPPSNNPQIHTDPLIIPHLEAKDALLRSGYLLEHRLESVLRRRGWYVEANEAYQDSETGRTRELDIYALAMRKPFKNLAGFVWAVLLIECVNNLQPMALITKQPTFAPFHSDDIKLGGLPSQVFIASKKAWQSIPDFLEMEKYHHYCRGRVATQFCSFARKKETKQWMALHEDLHFDAFRTLCTALEYTRTKLYSSWEFRAKSREYMNVEFYYPVVVLQNELLEVRPRGKSIRIESSKHLQFRRSFIYRGQACDYQIDVLTESFFPKYLSLVEKELDITAQRVQEARTEIQHSVERISRVAKRLRSPDKIRSVMEYKWHGLTLKKDGTL